MPPFRRLVPALVAAALVTLAPVTLAGVAQAAPAASRCAERGGVAAQAQRASDVFTGTLGAHRDHGKHTEWTVTVDRVYAGFVDTATVEVEAPSTVKACGLRGDTGDEYVFFAQRSGDELTVARGDGTAPATDALVTEVEDVLGPGKSATPPAPVEATFTMVADDPVELQRLAAPGVALVVVGLLGLALAGWRGRRAG